MLGIFQNFDFFLSPTSGSFHFVFFVCQSDHEQKNQLSCLFIFCIKKSTFCLKMTADFFRIFDHFDQKRKTKNEMNLTIKIKVFHPLFHSTFYRIGGMQACKSTTYTHTEKNTNSRVDFRFLRMNCCKMPSLLSGTSHRAAAAFQFVALCFSHDFLTVKQNQKMRYSRDCTV